MTWDVLNNSDLLEGKPRGSTILRNLIDSINSIIQEKLIDTSSDIEAQSSVLTATGVWLDYIGDRLKYPRPLIAPDDFLWFGFDGNGFGFDQANFTPGTSSKVGIDDDSYRKLLIVRGGQLITDCSIQSLNDTISGAFGSSHYIDNGNMTLDVVLDNSLDDSMIIAIVDSGLITKPSGVRIENLLIANTEGNFGFDGNGLGFDQALYVRRYEDLLEYATIYEYLTDDFGNFLIDNFGNFLVS